MFAGHFGLRENPFRSSALVLAPYPSRELGEALSHFTFARANGEDFFLLLGEAGTGKTTAIEAIVQSLHGATRVAVIRHSTLGALELIQEIVRRFGLDTGDGESRTALIARLERYLTDGIGGEDRGILIVDEAHLLSPSALEEVRLLSNLTTRTRPLLQICLVGQPELMEKLRKPRLRSLRQRISVRYVVGALSKEETAAYIRHRLRAVGAPSREIVSAAAMDAIFELSSGLPREINVVASQAMITAYLTNAQVVNADHVLAARKEFDFEGVALPPATDDGAAFTGPRAAVPKPLEVVLEPSRIVENPGRPNRLSPDATQPIPRRIQRADGFQSDELESDDEDLVGEGPERLFLEVTDDRGMRGILGRILSASIVLLIAFAIFVYLNPELVTEWTAGLEALPEISIARPTTGSTVDAGTDPASSETEPTLPLASTPGTTTTRPNPETSDVFDPTGGDSGASSQAVGERVDEPETMVEKALAAVPVPAAPTGRDRASETELPGSAPASPAIAEASKLHQGVDLARHGRLDEAIAVFREASDLEPNDPTAQYNLGLAFLQNGQAEDAVRALRNAAGVAVADAALHRTLGSALRQSGDLDGAMKAFREAVRLDPRDTSSYRQLGFVLRERGRFDEASDATAHAVALDPDDPALHQELGYCLRESGRLQEARVAFEQATRIDPNLGAAHYSLGIVLHEMGEETASRRELEQADRLGYAPR
jgi:type II secretory pathway predicted ATPase ExeA/Flp pilus assembly protein TadD